MSVKGQDPETIYRPFHLGTRPSLDGLRGVAILLVLAVHADLLSWTFGFIGVDLFFVLSGFLITCLLIEEADQKGRISLKNFYARRALRLLPALLAVLVGFIIFSAIWCDRKVFNLHLTESLAALFYSMNWVVAFDLARTNYLAHTWSLSIEEQFYILWPALVVYLLRRTTRTSLFSFVLFGVALSWLTRVLLFAGTAAAGERFVVGLDTRADALLLGCAVGVAVSSGLFPDSVIARKAARCGSVMAVLGLPIIGSTFVIACRPMYLWGWFLISLFSAAIILRLMVAPGGWMDRILSNRVLGFVGRISYGLYLWHYPIMQLIRAQNWPAWKNVLIGLPAVTLVPIASYYILERPCLRLKNRFRGASGAVSARSSACTPTARSIEPTKQASLL